MKKLRGALSLEATIAFTVFICFMFMLMLVVKMAMVVIAMDTVASETAKQIATSAYPLSLFNKMVDDNDETVQSYEKITGFTGFTEGAVGTAKTGILGHFTKKWTGDKDEDIKKDTLLSGIGVFAQAGASLVANTLFDAAEDLIGETGTNIVKNNIYQGLKEFSANIDMSKLTLVVCKLPMPEKTYKSGCTSAGYAELDLQKSDFGADDVVIGLTYDYVLTVPFFPSFNIKLKSVAIEHAWVNGGNNEPISTKEGIDFDTMIYGKHFYISTGGYGKKYHKGTCMTLWRDGRAQAISVARINAGTQYKPCDVCKPKIKK